MGNSTSYRGYINWNLSTEISHERCQSCKIPNFYNDRTMLLDFDKFRDIKVVRYNGGQYHFCYLCDNNAQHILFNTSIKYLSSIPYCYEDKCIKCNKESFFNQIIHKYYCIKCVEKNCCMCGKTSNLKNKIIEQLFNNEFFFCDECWIYKKRIQSIIKANFKVNKQNLSNDLLNTAFQLKFRMVKYKIDIRKFLCLTILNELLNDKKNYIGMLNRYLINIIVKYIK